MKEFKKTAGAAGIFALIYTFCMYKNTASITFPILMAAGIWILYFLQDERKVFDNKLSGFYVTAIMLIAVSVFMTGDWKLIFLSKTAVCILYLCLAIELYFDTHTWNDMKFVSQGIKIIFGSIGKGLYIAEDFGKYKEEVRIQGEEKKESAVKKQQIAKVFKGILIVLPLLFIIVPLMMSADIVFHNMIKSFFDMNELFEWLIDDINIFALSVTLLIAFVLYYGFIKIINNENKEEQLTFKIYGDKITGITVTGILCFIYGLFSIVQIRGILFSNVELPQGYTYAEYAREGFFQLFILAVINMLIVLICAAKYEYSKVLNIILYILCACTYVMIFSSAWKMLLYIKVYNLTFLRVMVLWSLAVIAVIMAAVIRYVYSDDFSLFKYMVVVVTSFYIIIAFARPDFIVAGYNLNFGNEEEVDIWYLSELSSDAAPIMSEHWDTINVNYSSMYYHIIKEKYSDMGIRDFNLSGYAALNLFHIR